MYVHLLYSETEMPTFLSFNSDRKRSEPKVVSIFHGGAAGQDRHGGCASRDVFSYSLTYYIFRMVGVATSLLICERRARNVKVCASTVVCKSQGGRVVR